MEMKDIYTAMVVIVIIVVIFIIYVFWSSFKGLFSNALGMVGSLVKGMADAVESLGKAIGSGLGAITHIIPGGGGFPIPGGGGFPIPVPHHVPHPW